MQTFMKENKQMHTLGIFIMRTPTNVDKVNFEIEKKK